MAFKDTVKAWFKTGDKPTQAQFYSKFDFLRWKDEKIVITDIEDIEVILDAKADAEALDNHINSTFDAIGFEVQNRANADETLQIQVDDANIEIAQVVNDIEAIKLLLTSDDINLDTVQEIVDAIKEVELSLGTILINDLTTGGTTKALTAQQGKVLKIALDALTAQVNAITSNVVTTVKTILSTALATQNVAGFVAYINALNPVLVVAANEIVKYQLTDTGRVFELKLRGRSFGVGQPAIVAADVLEITEWMSKDIILSNYTSSRNDGQLPGNRVAGFDDNGKLGIYTMAISPAPWIRELIPDSYLPDTTGNIRIYGDFFTPVMCDRVNNPNAIVLGGISVFHYATFVSSQEILVNVTTGSVEGTFSCTLNNGLSRTKPDALMIVLGEVFKPTSEDWVNITNEPDLSVDGEMRLQNISLTSGARWNQSIDITKKFRLLFSIKESPLVPRVSAASYPDLMFRMIDIVSGDSYHITVYLEQNFDLAKFYWYKNDVLIGVNRYTIAANFRIDYDGLHLYINQSMTVVNLMSVIDDVTLSNDWKLEFYVSRYDVKNIKYIKIT